MRILISKKGDATELGFSTLFAVLFAVIVGYSLFAFVDSVASSEYLDRTVLAKDLALTVDALETLPGRVILSYPRTLKEFKVAIYAGVDRNDEKLTGPGVTLTSIEGKTLGISNFNYFIPSNINYNSLDFPTKEIIEEGGLDFYNIYFEKGKDSLSFNYGDYSVQTLNAESKPLRDPYVVPVSDTNKAGWESNEIWVDIPTDRESFAPKNYYSKIYECTIINQEIVEPLESRNVKLQLTKNSFCDKSAILDRLKDELVIVLRKSQDSKETNNVNIYFTSDTESEKLAKILGNKIYNSDPTINVEVKKRDDYDSSFEYAGEKQLKKGIIFVAGTVYNNKMSKASLHLARALEEYYE